MPRLLHTSDRTDILMLAMNHLLANGGLVAPSLRALGRAASLSPATILHHLSDKDRLLRVLASRTGRFRLHAIERRAWREGPLAFLPKTDDELVDARVWLTWCELWRTDDGIGSAVSRIRSQEFELLSWSVDHELPWPDLQQLLALIDGLLVAVCAPTHAMTRGRASEILADQVRASRQRIPGLPPELAEYRSFNPGAPAPA